MLAAGPVGVLTARASSASARGREQGILVKARNFLVFQGDIEAVAQKSPKELTDLFEQIAGTDALRKDYEEAEARGARKQKRRQRQRRLVGGPCCCSPHYLPVTRLPARLSLFPVPVPFLPLGPLPPANNGS